jgi:hypothetical protein
MNESEFLSFILEAQAQTQVKMVLAQVARLQVVHKLLTDMRH